VGVWGTGVYSGDFAMDLRSIISAVARLPFEGDKLVDILCETDPRAASNPHDRTIPPSGGLLRTSLPSAPLYAIALATKR